MARQRESLSELAFMERELSWLADEAAGRMTDPDVAEHLRDLRDDHENAAARLGEALEDAGGEAGVPGELRESVRALQRGVRHAHDADGVVAAMLDAERAGLASYESALETGLPEETGRLVRERLAQARGRVGFLAEVAPEMLPRR
ncbi:MAG: ferritin-like domain-containing protein [Coriobacteriia bacterium]|nr:ferritin-like domain-containing protein [Coriobacteriia bacterium]